MFTHVCIRLQMYAVLLWSQLWQPPCVYVVFPLILFLEFLQDLFLQVESCKHAINKRNSASVCLSFLWSFSCLFALYCERNVALAFCDCVFFAPQTDETRPSSIVIEISGLQGRTSWGWKPWRSWATQLDKQVAWRKKNMFVFADVQWVDRFSQKFCPQSTII